MAEMTLEEAVDVVCKMAAKSEGDQAYHLAGLQAMAVLRQTLWPTPTPAPQGVEEPPPDPEPEPPKTRVRKKA